LNEEQTIFKRYNDAGSVQLKVANGPEPTLIQKNSDSSLSYTSNVSSSESASISSSVDKNPQKRFKVSAGSKSIPKIEKMKVCMRRIALKRGIYDQFEKIIIII